MHVEDVLTLEVPRPRRIPINHRHPSQFLSQYRFHFRRLPHEELALFAFRIRVSRGVERSTLPMTHLTIQVVQRLFDDFGEERIASPLPRV